MAVDDYLRRAADAVDAWFDSPEDSGETSAPDAVQRVGYGADAPEAVPTDATDGAWLTQTTAGVPAWVWLAGAAAGLVIAYAALTD